MFSQFFFKVVPFMR